MRLPTFALTSLATVLSEQAGPPDALGQSVKSWQPVGGPHPCASFPAGTRIVQQAQLRGVQVTREAYLPSEAQLSPITNRLSIDGRQYEITLVSVWDGFTVAGLTERG